MNRNVNQVGDESLRSWFDSIPLLTKIMVMSALITAGLSTFQMVAPYNLILLWPQVKNKFEVWRLLTAFVYAGGFSFNFAMHTLVLYENCRRYEANPYNTGTGGNSADMLWMIILAMGVLLILSYNFGLFLLSEELLYVIMYVWSRREPNLQMNLFGIRLKSIYLPWAYVGIRLLMGSSITEAIIGIAVGHLYFFLVEVLPVSHGYNLVKTPKFCVDAVVSLTRILPSPIGNTTTGFTVHAPPSQTATNTAGTTGAGAGASTTTAAQRSTGYQWGRGRALGAT